MQRYWIPLLTTDSEPELVDIRRANALGGIEMTLLNNAEPIKLAIYLAPFVALVILFAQLYLNEKASRKEAELQTNKALESQSRFLADLALKQHEQGSPTTAVALALEALPDRRLGISRPYLREAETSLYSAILDLRERATMRGHTWQVTHTAFSADGKTLLTSSNDHTVRLWDVSTGKEHFRVDDRGGAILAASFSPDGREILLAAYDGTARIVDIASRAVIRRLVGHRSALQDAKYSPNGERIITIAQADRNPRLWNAATGDEIAVLKGHTDHARVAVFAPDSSIVVTAGADGTVRAWHASDGNPLFQLAGHSEIKDVAFSPEGKLLASVGNDKFLRIWDVATRTALRTLSGGELAFRKVAFSPDSRSIAATMDILVHVWDVMSGEEFLLLDGHTGPVLRLAYSPDGKLLVTTSTDQTARLWDARNGRQIASLTGHMSTVYAAAFSPDGRLLATTSSGSRFDKGPPEQYTARLWDVGSALAVATLKEPRRILEPTVSPDGAWMVVRDSADFEAKLDASTRLWDFGTGQELRDLRVAGESVTRTLVSPDGLRVLTVERSGRAYLWNTITTERVTSLDCCVADEAFSNDGSMLAIAVETRSEGDRGFTIRLIKATDGKQILNFSEEKGDVKSLTISPDTKRLLAVVDGDVHIWNIAQRSRSSLPTLGHDRVDRVLFAAEGNQILTFSDQNGVRLWDAETITQLHKWQQLSAFDTPIVAADGRFLLLTSLSDDQITLHLIETGSNREWTLSGNAGTAVKGAMFSADSARLAVYSDDGLVHIRTPADPATLVTIGPSAVPITAITLSADGSRIAIALADGSVEIADTTSGVELIRLSGHRDLLNSVTFSRDERFLLGTNSDGATTQVWDVSTGRNIASLTDHETSVVSATFAGNGDRVVTIGTEKPAVTPSRALLVDTATGRVVSEIVAPALEGPAAPSEPNSISSIAFSDSGDRMLVDFSNGRPTIINLQTQKPMQALPADDRYVFSSTTLSPSGRLIARAASSAEGSQEIHIVDVDNASLIRSIATDQLPSSFVFSPDDRWLVVNFQEVVHSVRTGNADVAKPQ
jgi:WD40 repeat protein